MKTFPLMKSFNPPQLSEELVAAGISMAKGTIRAGTPAGASFAVSGEVVVDDAAADATVLAIIAAHVPKKSRLMELRDKRRSGLPLSPKEQEEILDILLGL